MSQDYPQLALDDLVHLMSPSPVPQTFQNDSDIPLRTESPSPSPLPQSDIVQMRRKATEMRHFDKSDAQLSSREKELIEMVLKLTAVVRPDSDQLLRQADMISALIQQRDLLLRQGEEQRLRWNSEKDGWARMAEALLAQQTKNRSNSERDEDYERLLSIETDNKGLRQRLSEAQYRLQMLESELTRLRPLLLMQPLISGSSMPPPTPNPKTQYARKQKKDTAATEDEDHGGSEEEPLVDPLDTPSHTSHSQATSRAKHRKSEAPNNLHPFTNIHKRRSYQRAISQGLSADARAEHLLLAARKIYKRRAGIMSGMVKHLEERERERRLEESATTAVAITPKTPKRNMAHVGRPQEAGYVYMNGQVRSGPGMQPVPLLIPTYPHYLLQTPSSSTTAPSVASSVQKPKQDARTNNPPTPLDSLLSAARSMMHKDDIDVDEDEEVDVVGESPRQTVGTRSTRPRDTFGSPVPKRRKVASLVDKLSGSHGLTSRTTKNASASSVNMSEMMDSGPGRFMSALDVLADQAAAFSTQDQSVPPQTQAQTKGKGKERADTPLALPGSTPKTRGRPKSRRKEAEADTPSSLAPTSRSRTPLSDMGDNHNMSGSTPTEAVGEFAPGAPVDPGGGMSMLDSCLCLSQTLDSTLASKRDQARATTNSDADITQLPVPTFLNMDTDVTPRQVSRVQDMLSEDGTRATIAQPSFEPPLVPSMGENQTKEVSQQQPTETTPSGAESGSSGARPTTSAAPTKNKDIIRVVEQDLPIPIPLAKRQRSPYVKWSKEEDDLLAQAVTKYGQKWDLVQKALPSRGYHQVRQRWLRKLGVFDNKPDLSSFQTAATTFSSTSRGDGVELRGNLKLGLAPLSSEKAFSGFMGRSPYMPS